MPDKPICFIISPIGESGSEIRQNADDLRDLLIKPLLESYGFKVLRGDHRSEAGQIDIDVIRAVQESDLCIVDLSLPNPNVYYEFGRRDETGKPLILLKAKGSDDLPVDVATRRYIEYDLDSRRGLIDAREQLKNFIEPLVQKGFDSNGTGASLSELAEILRRVERKIDRISNESTKTDIPPAVVEDDDTDPVDLLKFALRQKNIPLAERAMQLLSFRMSRFKWFDQIVESVASIGSVAAGDMLIENIAEFMDSAETFKQKVEFIGSLVNNLNRTDRELENVELVEKICNSLKAVSENENVHERILLYNQLNRLYFGVYYKTDEIEWVNKAIEELNKAINLSDKETYLYYNLAMCLKARNEEGDAELALKNILRCMELDNDDKDVDHLVLVCELMHTLEDERLSDYLDVLEQVNPIKAKNIRSKWKNQ